MMPAHDWIPALDPIPLPAPYWLFKLLLVLTFTLHILAMNCLVGGTALALASRWIGMREQANRLFSDIATKLPSLLPATVTLAVAPLLFLQVLYGQFFYTSSVLIAWPWLLLLVILTVAYYGLYWVSSKNHRQAGSGRWILLGCLLLVAVIGFLLVNNTTLSLRPARWPAKYFADSSGWNLNLSEPTLVPRYLHFLTAAVAIGGLFLMWIAYLKRDSEEDYRQYVFRFGGIFFTGATAVQLLVGLGFLVSLPEAQRALFLGRSIEATALLGAGILGALLAMALVAYALLQKNYRLGALGGSGITAVVVALMAVIRDLLRDDYLKPYFHPEHFAVQTQWAVLPLFLAVFLGGVALWAAMMWRYPFTRKTGDTRSE